jgi:HEAT repeat protein
VSSRFVIAILMVASAIHIAAAQSGAPASNLKSNIDTLSSFDYSSRMNAARALRRAAPAEVVPALIEATRRHSDEFVRYRALIVLTSFNDRGTPELMRTLLQDRNDRVREVVYRWFERNPEPALSPLLLAALNTEQSEFVRPALVRAVAALPSNDAVRRALVAEIGRGFDFFRSAVIDALGDYRATYAVDAITAVALADGPLQDDAVLALGRIGDRRALVTLSTLTNTSGDVAAALQAAQCMLGDTCAPRIEWLTTTARSQTVRPEAVRAAVAALGTIAQQDAAARTALLGVAQDGSERVTHEVALAFSGIALRRPNDVLMWLSTAPEGERSRVIELLRDGFESLEEDFAEEQFFATIRAAYWKEAEGSSARTLVATLIEKLEF